MSILLVKLSELVKSVTKIVTESVRERQNLPDLKYNTKREF